MSNKINLLYFVVEDWYFWSHRKSLALAAANKGFEIHVMTRVNKHGEKIRELGFNLIPIELDRHGGNLYYELILLLQVIKTYKRLKPEIVHHISTKPILYGTIAAVFSKISHVVNTFPGFGYLFNSQKIKHKIVSNILKKVFILLFKKKSLMVIVQNIDNAEYLVNEGICNKKSITIIKGSGVDLGEYLPSNVKKKVPVILFAARLLWQKGIADFISAAGIVKKNRESVRFIIVGKPDTNNPDSVTIADLLKWDVKERVEWWGYRSDMATVIAQSSIVVLPTFYGEGVPRILIESAACGKPIITTNIPGCRDIVKHEINGFLVPTHDPVTIARYLERLIDDHELCLKMGSEGRKMVASEFAIEKINTETLQVYDKLLGVP